MRRSKKIEWKRGDVFAIPLKNGKYSIGQILDQVMVNTIRVALFDEVIDMPGDLTLEKTSDLRDLISLIEVTKEQVTYGVWKIVGNKEVNIPVSRYPNEQFRNNKWIGSIVYDAALAEDFVNAFYAFIPWDNWYDPNYLDKFLIDKNKKPGNLILTKTGAEKNP